MRRNTRYIALPLTWAFLLLSSFAMPREQPQQENQIHVEIIGLRNDRGQVLCALFSSAEDFPKKADRAVASTSSAISNLHAICDFPGVVPGTYAVSVVHDENSNGKLDTNFVGIPNEGVGTSNNAKKHFGPPKFAAASFRFSGKRLALEIALQYL